MYGDTSSRRWGRRGLTLALFGALALIIAGCAAKAAAVVSYEDNGTTIQLERGTTLQIVLDVPPGAGLWRIQSYEENLLDLKSAKAIELVQPSRYGGHTFHRLEFTTLGTGTTRVKLAFTSLDEFNDISDTFWVRVMIN